MAYITITANIIGLLHNFRWRMDIWDGLKENWSQNNVYVNKLLNFFFNFCISKIWLACKQTCMPYIGIENGLERRYSPDGINWAENFFNKKKLTKIKYAKKRELITEFQVETRRKIFLFFFVQFILETFSANQWSINLKSLRSKKVVGTNLASGNKISFYIEFSDSTLSNKFWNPIKDNINLLNTVFVTILF